MYPTCVSSKLCEFILSVTRKLGEEGGSWWGDINRQGWDLAIYGVTHQLLGKMVATASLRDHPLHYTTRTHHTTMHTGWPWYGPVAGTSSWQFGAWGLTFYSRGLMLVVIKTQLIRGVSTPVAFDCRWMPLSDCFAHLGLDTWLGARYPPHSNRRY